MTKKTTIFIVMAVLCLNFSTKAQSVADSIAMLRVGDKVPAAFWQHEYKVYRNGKATTETMAPYKDKFLLLDFWAVWCGACIDKFPLMDSLQQKFPQFTVMLVNKKNVNDGPEKLMEFMDGKKDPFQKVVFPSVMEDVFLNKYFPHKVIPHYVWIANGYVRAITATEFLDEHNVKIMLLKNDKLNKPKQPVQQPTKKP